jgi:hypothetical protein
VLKLDTIAKFDIYHDTIVNMIHILIVQVFGLQI